MAGKSFSRKEAICFGWGVMKKNFWFFAGILIIFGVIEFVPNILTEIIKKDAPLAALMLNIMAFILKMIVSLGIVKISLMLYDKQTAKISDLFGSYNLFFRYVWASIAYGLAIMGGVLLLIIPGIIIAIRCQFYGYLMVDKGLGAIASLKESFAMTKGHTWNLLAFGALQAGVVLLGALALLLGLFAAIPTTMLATTFVYRFLVKQKEGILPATV